MREKDLNCRVAPKRAAAALMAGVFGVALLSVGYARAQSDALPRADKVVAPSVRVTPVVVPRGHMAEVAVTGKIRRGFHVNANPASQDYLIPTQLAADLPAGFSTAGTSYPPGVMRKFKFSRSAISVYENSFTIRMRLQVAGDAPVGKQRIPMMFRYQACNEEACLPPVKMSLSAEVEVTAAGAKVAAAPPAGSTPARPRK